MRLTRAWSGACDERQVRLTSVAQEWVFYISLTEEDCRIELGVRLYADRRISLAQALRLSGLNRGEFARQLADRDVSLYTVDDLRDDVETLKTLGRL